MKSVKLIKRQERAARKSGPMADAADPPSKCLKTVRSWVVEFQERDRSESLRHFDSLFEDLQPESAELIS